MRHQNALPRRGSLRSRTAATVTSLTLRPLTAAIPANRHGVLAARRIAATSLALLGPGLAGSQVTRIDRPGGPGPSIRGEWVRGPGAGREDAVILYLHGSAYTICSARTHRGITTRLSRTTGLPVFACDYRLAPNHTFPSAADDVRAAYEWLLAEGHEPERIVLAGDSAGGHLAVDLSLQLIREGAPPPASVVLFSPVLDLTMGLSAQREQIQRDPMISAARAARLIGLYLGEEQHAAPRLTLTFDDTRGFPPTLVQAGSREMLAADAAELAESITAGGGQCELEVWPDQMHVFQALPRIVPEARPALARAGGFIVSALDAVAQRGALSTRESA
jgi:acetyl esterase/lipase